MEPSKTLPAENMLKWAEKLKRREVTKNPFVTSRKPIPVSLKILGGGFAGAGLIAFANKILENRVSNNFFLVYNGVSASLILALPESSVTAGMGGAVFYSLLEKSYKKIMNKP